MRMINYPKKERIITMKDINATGEFYTINHVTLITGLSERTVRSHIASGILQGEKINGLWHFSPRQVEDFLSHPAVRPAILTKNNTIVYDFLLDSKKSRPQCCIILDMPGEDQKAVAEYFCYTISSGDFSDLRFSFDSVDGVPRVILRGHTDQVMELVKGYNTNSK